MDHYSTLCVMQINKCHCDAQVPYIVLTTAHHYNSKFNYSTNTGLQLSLLHSTVSRIKYVDQSNIDWYIVVSSQHLYAVHTVHTVQYDTVQYG